MFENYLKTAFRNLKRNKAYALLNVVGLALGIGCSLVIFKVIQYETSFDKHQENFEKINRVVNESIFPDRVSKSMGIPHPLGPSILADYPEIKYMARTHYTYGDQMNVRKSNGDMKKFLIEDGVVFTENNFFKMFTIDWVAGDRESALSEPNTAVISKEIARRLFELTEGEESEAIGNVVNYNNRQDFKVVGIVEDPIETTNFQFKMFFEYYSQEKINPYFGKGENWHSSSSNTNLYILPESGIDPVGFNSKLVDIVEKYHGEGDSEKERYIIQPLSEIHFDQEYGSYSRNVSIEFLIALGIIGIFLVLTACINFINLATAQAANRSKEIGIRKAIGSMTGQLISQFMAEIAMIAFIAVLMSLAIAELMFINLEDIIGYRLTLNLFDDFVTGLFLFILFVLVSVLSGLYPSFLLARMNTVLALKNKITAKNNSGGLSLRKGLVILQFTISQFLIVGTLVITAQMDYFNNKDLGFETEAIITTYLPERGKEGAIKSERFKQEMLASPTISDVTFSLSQPTGNSNSNSNFNYEPLNSENNYHGNFKVCDDRYMDFFGFEILAGRKIEKGDSNNVVINRKIADLMGFADSYDMVVGEKLNTGWGGEKTVVGVIENFHTYSLEEEIDYVLLINTPSVYYSISFKTSSESGIDNAINHFKDTWEKIYPEYVNDYDFYDEEIAENYEYEKSISSLMRIFSIISILIGCLGLYGLISFIAINKNKEIGVRKVLGASVFNILTIFSKEIVMLMTVAFFIATPIAYYLLNQWLETYTFRITMSYNFFVLAFIITFLIAIITISHRTISSALLNPATTLKDE